MLSRQMVFALRLRTGVGFLLALAAIWLPVGGLCYGLSQINLDAARVVLVVLFLGHAVYALRAIKPAGREIGPTSTDPYGEWVYRMAEAVRPAAGLSKLKIFIRPDDEPNTWVAHCPGSAPVLVVNKGLIDRYTDGALFQAILAHQLGHILTGDAVWRTVFLDLPALVLEVAQSVPLALGAGLLALLRGFSQCFDRRAVGPGCLNVVSAPFRLLFDQLRRQNLFSMQGLIILMILPFAVLLIATIVISLVANVMATVLTYVIMALSAGLAVFCYAFFGLITVNAFRRQTEMAADLVGAQLLEFPMPMAQALHRLLQLEAGEGRLLQKFVVTYGTGTEAGNFPQLMRLLRSNPIRLTAPDWWRELLRTHPYALRRLSHVIQAIHQALTRTGP